MTRRVSLTGISTDAPDFGARGTSANYFNRLKMTQAKSSATGASPKAIITSSPVIPFPSRSILTADDPLEPLNFSQARLNKALVFALAINFLAWGFILLAGRALASIFL